MPFTSVKWEWSTPTADYVAPKSTEAFSAADRDLRSLCRSAYIYKKPWEDSALIWARIAFYLNRNTADLCKRPSGHYGSQRSPSGGGWSALLREVSVSFNWGGGGVGGQEEERSEGIEDAGKLPSSAGVCQQQAAPVHTVGKCGPAWAGPGLRKTNQD